MEGTARKPAVIRFGPFQADSGEDSLHRNGVRVRLQDQPLQLLFLLLERPGQIVTREEMRSRLWPDESFGDFDNGLNVAVRKLRAALGDDPGQPRYIETVPRKGYRFIAEVAPEPEPEPTPEIVSEFTHPLTRLPDGAARAIKESPVQPKASKRATRIALTALILVACVGLLISTLIARRPLPPHGERTKHTGRRSIAVLAFRNSSGRPEDAWLSTALSEMFSTELAAGDQLRLVPGEDIVHARLAQPSIDVDSVSVSTAQQLHRMLETDLIVSGAYSAVASGDARQVRLDVRLQDAVSGEILTEASGNATERTLFHVVSDVGERLRQRLGASFISATEHAEVAASMPSNREAGEFFSQGLLKLRAYDALAARDLLRQAIAAEPQFPLAHAALSDAWARLGYDKQAVEEARKASDLASSLLPTGRLRVQACYWEATGDWKKAAEAYRTLHSSFPDDPEYGVLLARSLTRGGQAKEAIDVLGSDARIGTDPGVELAVADAASSLGDLARASSAAQAAASSARARGQLFLLARALRTQGLALEGLARYDQAIAAAEESRALYEWAGDRFGVASVLEVQGNILSDRGDLPGALQKYQQELTIVREVGNKRGEASALNNMALVLYQQGDLTHSRAMWEQAKAAFGELGDKGNISVVLVNIGGALKDQGDLAAAGQNYEQALRLARETRDSSGTVLAMNALGTVLDAQGKFAAAEHMLRQSAAIDTANGRPANAENLADMADVLEHRGELAAAGKAYRDALAASEASGEKTYAAYAHFGLGRLALLAADFAEAGRQENEALRLRKELGETFSIAETEVALAELAIEQDHAAATEASLRRGPARWQDGRSSAHSRRYSEAVGD